MRPGTEDQGFFLLPIYNVEEPREGLCHTNWEVIVLEMHLKNRTGEGGTNHRLNEGKVGTNYCLLCLGTGKLYQAKGPLKRVFQLTSRCS